MPGRNFTDAEEAEIAKIYLAGNSAKAIMRAYGLNHHISICAALRRQGITQRPAPERNRLYKLNPHVFDVIDNELAAYWWGFLYADSTVSRRSLLVHLKVSDKEQLEKLRVFMESESPITERHSNIGKVKYNNACIEFTDRHMADKLRELGIIVNRPNPIVIPKYLPDHLTHHWIRGYFDGDGSARREASIAFCGSQQLLIWLRAQFAIGAGTNPGLAVSKHKTANIWYIYINGRVQSLRVADYMYREATIWLPRKRDVIDNWPKPQIRHRNEKGQWI